MINFDKVSVIASYLADNIDRLYVTKLLKLFYYIDFISFAERQAAVTNDTYYKLPYGPIPSVIKNEIDNLMGSDTEIKSQLVKSIKLVVPPDQNGRMVVNVNKNYDLKLLSAYERKLVDRVLTKFKTTTAKTISQNTHKEKPYKLSSENSIIPYEYASYLDVEALLS